MEAVANSVGVITGTVQLLVAIHKSIEAIEDAPQQIRHLQVICHAASLKLEDICHQLRSVKTIGDRNTYYESIYQVVRSMEIDVILIREQIPKEIPSRRWFARLKNSNVVHAVDIALNQNKEAIARFERSMNVLMWTTTKL